MTDEDSSSHILVVTIPLFIFRRILKKKLISNIILLLHLNIMYSHQSRYQINYFLTI